MQAHVFGELQLSCFRTPSNDNSVTNIPVTKKLKTIKIKKSYTTAWVVNKHEQQRKYNPNAFGSLYKNIRLLINNGYETDEVKRILKVSDEQIKLATTV